MRIPKSKEHRFRNWVNCNICRLFRACILLRPQTLYKESLIARECFDKDENPPKFACRNCFSRWGKFVT